MSQQEYEFLIDCGYPKALRDCMLDVKTEMVECVILHYTHYRIRAELDQIKDGLAKVGVLSAIKQRPYIWKSLLCADRRLDITVEYIRQLFEPSFSETGSNARLVEEDLIYNWEDYLKEMGKIRFSFYNENKAPYSHLKSLDRTGYWKLFFILQDIILANSKTSMSG